MTRTIGRTVAVAFLASALLTGCAHTTAKVNAAGSERGYSSSGEVGLGVPF
jgi:hypothetical protein